MDWSILWRLGPYLAVDKPADLAVHRGLAPDAQVLMLQLRDVVGCHVYPAHRLDRPTSGVVLFALNPEAAHVLAAQFAAGTVQKRYLALARGPVPECWSTDHPVPRSEDGPRVDAVTHFRRLWASPVERVAWVEAVPETGRYHQIRRHLKHASHPIIGDVRYGKGDWNRRFRQEYGLSRLALHARAITFEVEGAAQTVQAAVPESLRGPLLKLGVPPSLVDGDCETDGTQE